MEDLCFLSKQFYRVQEDINKNNGKHCPKLAPTLKLSHTAITNLEEVADHFAKYFCAGCQHFQILQAVKKQTAAKEAATNMNLHT